MLSVLKNRFLLNMVLVIGRGHCLLFSSCNSFRFLTCVICIAGYLFKPKKNLKGRFLVIKIRSYVFWLHNEKCNIYINYLKKIKLLKTHIQQLHYFFNLNFNSFVLQTCHLARTCNLSNNNQKKRPTPPKKNQKN